ncbi:MAG: MBL fold metallo-hydrolase, partial [Cytophagaceae bacterium]
MKITFWGAARQVTGSKFLLELEDGYKILIDCGTDLSRDRQEGDAYFPFEPSDINLVLLTHAHIDHSGAIPLLYQYGYSGQVLCTTPTYALTELLLRDAAGINSQRIQKKWNPKKKKLKEFIPDDVYLDSQVDFATRRFVNIAFNEKFAVKP